MESPNNGRATIEDDVYGMTITIPSQTNWFITIFVGFWLFMWSIGIISILTMAIFNRSGNSIPGIVVLLMTCIWAAFMIIPLRIFLWNVAGKEIISIEPGTLAIDKKGLIFYKAKSYDLSEVKNFRVQEDNSAIIGPFGLRPSSILKTGSSGTIRFDYGFQTIKIADGMDEAEANFILEKLETKKLLNQTKA